LSKSPSIVSKSANQPKIFKKLAKFTDIHFGRRNNSRVHNQDCLDFIEWFAGVVENDGTYSHVCFLGDWFESRSAINIETMEYSYKGLQRLNSIGLPIYFIVGNHDLHRRTTREVHSVRMFNELENVTVIDKPQVIDNILFSPFLFEHEFQQLIQFNDLWAFIGHFEFQGFVVTGQNKILDHGASHKLFPGPKRIFSGHFHKRQQSDNVVYIGNAFPMDFGDAGDYKRGMCTYDVVEDKVTFRDWKECPKYYKVQLSRVIEEKWSPLAKMKVKCIADVEIGYKEAQELRDVMVQSYNLRDFNIDEDREAKQGLLEGDGVDVKESELELSNIDEMVVKQLEILKEDKSTTMDIEMLIKIYNETEVELEEDDE
jgi:DNA repair exonuclease SbcCD nuclease subunit